jgi:hypothetical protein
MLGAGRARGRRYKTEKRRPDPSVALPSAMLGAGRARGRRYKTEKRRPEGGRYMGKEKDARNDSNS